MNARTAALVCLSALIGAIHGTLEAIWQLCADQDHMTTVLCTRTPNCARAIGHAGVCTAAPSAATLDWDQNREATQQHHIDRAITLLTLDFPTPPWADLLDQ